MSAASGDAHDPAAVSLWSDYAKDRYDTGERRLADLRNWARQLTAAAGVVVGLEAALMAQVLKLLEDCWLGLAGSVLLLLVAAAYQLVTMGRAIGAGYIGTELLLAESPAVLAEHVAGKDEAWMRRTIGAYYAKSSDTIHAAAESLAKDVGAIARHFRRSLWLLFAVMIGAGSLTVLVSHARKAMSDTIAPAPAAPEPGATPQTPAPGDSPSPAATPLLVTPTPGQTETRGAPSPRETLLATPTPGQRLTEGTESTKK